jgi:HAD superfamily hydrolase (TIGR01450 family)
MNTILIGVKDLSKKEIKEISSIREQIQSKIKSEGVKLKFDAPVIDNVDIKTGKVCGKRRVSFLHLYLNSEYHINLFMQVKSTIEFLSSRDTYIVNEFNGKEFYLISAEESDTLLNDEVKKTLSLIYASEVKSDIKPNNFNNNKKFFSVFSDIKKNFGFLINFDGVINLCGKLAPHSKEFFEFIENHKLRAFLISNSTLKTSNDIKNFLHQNNLTLNIPIVTPTDLALKYIQDKYQRVAVYCTANVKKVFRKYIDDSNPQAIIIGNLSNNWSIQTLNEIFLKIHNGADLIALQMSSYWLPQDNQLLLDSGSYISAIEYATSKKAIVIGKTQMKYFNTAEKILGYPQSTSFLMLGDDIATDVIPMKDKGSKAILILTGKTNLKMISDSYVFPDFIANDLSDVIEYLKTFYALE